MKYIILGIAGLISLIWFSEYKRSQVSWITVGKCYDDNHETRAIITHKLNFGYRFDFQRDQSSNCLESNYQVYNRVGLEEIDCLPEFTELKKCK